MSISAPQTSVIAAPPGAVAGMVADNDPSQSFVTFYASAGLAQGRFFKRGTTTNYDVGSPIAAAADVTTLLAGLSVFDTMRMPKTPHYSAKDPVRTMRRGRMWVEAAGTIATGDTVYVVHSGADAGLVQGAAGAGPDATAVPNGAAKCLKGGSDGDLVLIEINLP